MGGLSQAPWLLSGGRGVRGYGGTRCCVRWQRRLGMSCSREPGPATGLPGAAPGEGGISCPCSGPGSAEAPVPALQGAGSFFLVGDPCRDALTLRTEEASPAAAPTPGPRPAQESVSVVLSGHGSPTDSLLRTRVRSSAAAPVPSEPWGAPHTRCGPAALETFPAHHRLTLGKMRFSLCEE